MKKTEILAVIHARGGSKRIPLKNLALLGDRPLLAYPIELARGSSYVTRTVLSTDHDGIMEAGKTWGAEVPFRRPADISEDVPSELVTAHALRHLAEVENYHPEIVVTLTPATPFTKVSQLDQGIQMLLEHPDWDSVVTVRRAAEHPEWTLWKDEAGFYKTVLGNPMNGAFNVSQNLRPAFYPVGAFFINRVKPLLENPCLYGRRFGAVYLEAGEHVDIDTPQDLLAANAIAARREAPHS